MTPLDAFKIGLDSSLSPSSLLSFSLPHSPLLSPALSVALLPLSSALSPHPSNITRLSNHCTSLGAEVNKPTGSVNALENKLFLKGLTTVSGGAG